MSHEYHYNRTGKERKTLVKLIAEILGETAVYRKAPTFSYDIGFCHIDKNGTLSCPEEMNPDPGLPDRCFKGVWFCAGNSLRGCI